MGRRAAQLWVIGLVSLGAACWREGTVKLDGPADEVVTPSAELESTDPESEDEASELGSKPASGPAATPLVEVEIPEPEPLPFAGREQVRVDELLAALRDELEAVAASPAVRADYETFLVDFELADDDALYLDYVRVKLAFEATRDGGLWGLAWDITNEQPNSEKIWAQWQTRPFTGEADAGDAQPVTAIAECDELSALFAFVAHGLGLSKRSEVGLFWPTGNHVVAVWTLDRKGERPVRVVVPTTQIFLDDQASLGTRGFDPWRQRKIFDYRRGDAAPELEIPGALARYFIAQVRGEAGRSQLSLQAARNRREAARTTP